MSDPMILTVEAGRIPLAAPVPLGDFYSALIHTGGTIPAASIGSVLLTLTGSEIVVTYRRPETPQEQSAREMAELAIEIAADAGDPMKSLARAKKVLKDASLAADAAAKQDGIDKALKVINKALP